VDDEIPGPVPGHGDRVGRVGEGDGQLEVGREVGGG